MSLQTEQNKAIRTVMRAVEQVEMAFPDTEEQENFATASLALFALMMKGKQKEKTGVSRQTRS